MVRGGLGVRNQDLQMDGPAREVSPPPVAPALGATSSERGPGGSGDISSSGDIRSHAWERFEPWWHGAFATVVAGTAAFALLEYRNHPARLAAVLGLYGALAAWFGACLAAGRLSSGPRCKPYGGSIYLAGALGLFIAADFVWTGSGFLLFILMPQCFMLLRRRLAYVAAIGLTVVDLGAVMAGFNSASTSTVVSMALFGLLGLALALLLGGYIGRIIEQSVQRAALIEELERTRAELAETSHAAGRLGEREHLAREIHDVLAQGFTSVIMLLQAARAALEREDWAAARHSLGLAEPAAREGLAEARALIAALSPPPLQGSTLADALGRVCADLGARFGFAARLEVQGEELALSNNVEIVLLRSAQEALANVGRHARATAASVTLSFASGGVSLTVADDGVGFEPGLMAGFGLNQLRSRAAQVGGSAGISSSAGRGTVVEVTIPLGGGYGWLESDEPGSPAPPRPSPAPHGLPAPSPAPHGLPAPSPAPHGLPAPLKPPRVKSEVAPVEVSSAKTPQKPPRVAIGGSLLECSVTRRDGSAPQAPVPEPRRAGAARPRSASSDDRRVL
jgi:signal transduction histidine kinase